MRLEDSQSPQLLWNHTACHKLSTFIFFHNECDHPIAINYTVRSCLGNDNPLDSHYTAGRTKYMWQTLCVSSVACNILQALVIGIDFCVVCHLRDSFCDFVCGCAAPRLAAVSSQMSDSTPALAVWMNCRTGSGPQPSSVVPFTLFLTL